MHRVVVFAFLVSVCVAPLAKAGYGAGDARLEKLYSTFMAPCCWRENLTWHDSGAAEDLRDSIRTMVHEGRSDDEIKTALVERYTKRILALPEGPQRAWLFWTPWLFAVAGLSIVMAFLRRLGKRGGLRASTGTAAAELADGWDWD
jgi:cytochrome c-type biogenesis protein CcmH